MVGSEACPEHVTVLQQPHLGKLVHQLRKYMADTDSGVREACAEAFFNLAEATYNISTGLLPGKAEHNPLLRALFDGLGDSKKETQGTAGMALSKVGVRVRVLRVRVN